jgi:hypothetical protein
VAIGVDELGPLILIRTKKEGEGSHLNSLSPKFLHHYTALLFAWQESGDAEFGKHAGGAKFEEIILNSLTLSRHELFRTHVLVERSP